MHGPCAEGVQICECSMGGIWGPCEGAVTPVPEICGNHIDDDCNGVIDDGCP